MTAPTKTRFKCKQCGMAVVADGSRWMHADGKVYRHIIEPVLMAPSQGREHEG